MHWGGFHLTEVAGRRISSSKSETMEGVDTGKGWLSLSRLVERSCLKRRCSSILGSCSWMREGWKMSLPGDVVYRTIVVKKSEVIRESTQFSDQSELPFSPMVVNYGEWAQGQDHRYRWPIGALSQGGCPLELWWEGTWEELGIESLLLPYGSSQLRWLVHPIRDLMGGVPAWKHLWILPEELEEMPGMREVWASLLRLLPLGPR